MRAVPTSSALLIAAMIAMIILATIFAPGAVAAVVGTVTTVTAWILRSPVDDTKPPTAGGPGAGSGGSCGAPTDLGGVLRFAAGAIFGHARIAAMVGLLAISTACGILSAGGVGLADAAYTADLQKCVHSAKTLPESRACRDEMDRRYGVDAGAYLPPKPTIDAGRD